MPCWTSSTRPARKASLPTASSGYCAVETAEGIKRCTFTWNHKRFKDPADWFAQMEKRGIVVSPNIKPGMLLVHPLLNEMKEKGMFLPASDDNAGLDGLAVGTWWGGPGLFVDYTKESTRQHWKQYIKDALLKYGWPAVPSGTTTASMTPSLTRTQRFTLRARAARLAR
jgi:alpha-glucosidase